MPELPFTLDQLRILKAIAAQGSFKKAADLLYVTQPSTEEGQRESRRKIYSIAAVWVVLVFVTGIVSSLV